MSVRRGSPPRGDDGTILLLSLGFCVIALMLLWAVVDASAVFLARRDLAAAVDGTALAAAQQVDAEQVYATGARDDLPLDPARVAATVDAYVERTYPHGLYPTQRITGGVGSDGRTVAVAGTRTVRLPGFGSVTVSAHATAANRRREELAPNG